MMASESCVLRPLGDATVQLTIENATASATPVPGKIVRSPMTGRELRMQLSVQQGRNRVAGEATGGSLEVAPDAPRNPPRRWLITRPDGKSFTTTTVPPATLAEMQYHYVGCAVEQADGTEAA